MKKIEFVLVAFVFMAPMLIGQEKPARESTPTFNATEQIALKQLSSESNAAQEAQRVFQKDMAAFQMDFAKDHSGWIFDPSQGIVKAPKADIVKK